MTMTHQPDGTTNWEARWPALVPAARVRHPSRGLTVALIVGLSAVLWELVFGAVRLLITI